MTYEQQLQSLLEEILNQFDQDIKGYLIYNIDGVFQVDEELEILLDRANDLIYGTGGEGGDESCE